MKTFTVAARVSSCLAYRRVVARSLSSPFSNSIRKIWKTKTGREEGQPKGAEGEEGLAYTVRNYK